MTRSPVKRLPMPRSVPDPLALPKKPPRKGPPASRDPRQGKLDLKIELQEQNCG